MKSKARKLTVMMLALALAPLAGRAQNTQKLTLDEAVKKGLDYSHTLRLDKSKIEVATIKYQEAKDAHLPDVKLNIGYTYLSDLDYKTLSFGPVSFALYENNNYMGHLSATEPIFTGYRIKYAEESARLLMEASKLDVDKDKDEVTMTIINSYFNLYKAQATKKRIDESIDQIKQRLTEVQDAMNNGTAIQNDVLRVQLQLSNTQLSQLEAANTIQIVNYNLDVLLGLPNNTTVELDSASMFAAKNMKTADDYQSMAINQRTELKNLSIKTKAAENGIKIANSAYYPTIGVGADYYYARPNQRYFPVLDEFKPTWDAGINLTWNITGLFTNKQQVAEANAGLMQTKIAASMQTDAIKMEVNSAYTSYTEAMKKIDVAKQSVNQAQENYRTLTSRYNNHVALLSDLLDAQNLLLQSKINETLAEADAELAYKKLLKATGSIASK